MTAHPTVPMASWGCPKIQGVFLFLGLHLFQTILGTTIIPLCRFNATENCTTALENNPRVAQVELTECKSEWQNFCFNGECIYVAERDQPHCRCYKGYTGHRCSHSILDPDLVQQPLTNEYVALALLLVIFFLAAVAIAMYYGCRWHQNKKKRLATSENYKEIPTEAGKDHKLLNV
ncbi:proepiregulin isoform X2 [Hemicordylus capensis]|uniref:proepiregulin isoform X2 n=1 Tax=Hemicordylus capensis TaxID=884348 RepID=UPI0023021925|nr:proepiregulin isoform X2 [Hemicordylus capensis]